MIIGLIMTPFEPNLSLVVLFAVSLVMYLPELDFVGAVKLLPTPRN